MVEPEIQKSVALMKILKARQNVLVTHFENQAGRKIDYQITTLCKTWTLKLSVEKK